MQLVNLTPNPAPICDNDGNVVITVPPSGQVARLGKEGLFDEGSLEVHLPDALQGTRPYAQIPVVVSHAVRRSEQDKRFVVTGLPEMGKPWYYRDMAGYAEGPAHYNVTYITYKEVADAVGRPDVYYLGPEVQDAEGRVIGHRGLSVTGETVYTGERRRSIVANSCWSCLGGDHGECNGSTVCAARCFCSADGHAVLTGKPYDEVADADAFRY